MLHLQSVKCDFMITTHKGASGWGDIHYCELQQKYLDHVQPIVKMSLSCINTLIIWHEANAPRLMINSRWHDVKNRKTSYYGSFLIFAMLTFFVNFLLLCLCSVRRRIRAILNIKILHLREKSSHYKNKVLILRKGLNNLQLNSEIHKFNNGLLRLCDFVNNIVTFSHNFEFNLIILRLFPPWFITSRNIMITIFTIFLSI